MSNTYSLKLAQQGASTSAYYSILPTSNAQITQGAVTIHSTAPGTTLVSIVPTELQIQSPPGSLTSGVTVITSESAIAGRLAVSPPVNVAVTLTLEGAGGAQLGQFTLDAGVDGGNFSFSVVDG